MSAKAAASVINLLQVAAHYCCQRFGSLAALACLGLPVLYMTRVVAMQVLIQTNAYTMKLLV